MAIIPWSPFNEIEKKFEDERGEWFPIIPAHLQKFPPINLYEKNDKVIVDIEIPDTESKNIDISIENNVLKIRGEEKEKKEEKRANYYLKEIKGRSFERNIVLPMNVKEKQAKAVYKKGVLTIEIPKDKKAIKSNKVKIKIKE